MLKNVKGYVCSPNLAVKIRWLNTQGDLSLLLMYAYVMCTYTNNIIVYTYKCIHRYTHAHTYHGALRINFELCASWEIYGWKFILMGIKYGG